MMRWVSALAGSVATGAAAIVLVSVGQTASATAVAGSEILPPSAAEVAAPITTPITEPSQLPSVGTLDDAVAEALGNTGYAQSLTPDEQAELDPAVVRVLSDAGVILVIREEGGD